MLVSLRDMPRLCFNPCSIDIIALTVFTFDALAHNGISSNKYNHASMANIVLDSNSLSIFLQDNYHGWNK